MRLIFAIFVSTVCLSLHSDDFLGHDHIATSDGSHPTDLGFTRMLDSISPKILKILRKYGIR